MHGCNERRVLLVAVAAALLGASSVAMAQEDVEEVIVTGSRIARPNLESAVPVMSVAGEELFQTGNTAMGDLLNDLPSMRTTFGQSNSSRFLGTTGLNLLDLRGLGTQRTLVLVNGRRHVGADILVNAVSPDTNTFPTDLVERIDVVTGGNSAVYGSDAIAGVVNFVLKRDFEGFQVRGQGGQSSKGDNDTYYASVLAGTNFFDDRGNIAVNVEYAKQEAFFASARSNLRRQGLFVAGDTDPNGSPNGADDTFDRVFYADARFATLANGGSLLLTPTVASGLAPCGRDALGRAYGCSFLFQPDGSITPQTGTRIGLAPNGNYDGGNGTSNRERNAMAIFPDLERASVNVVGHLTISEAFEPFIEAKYVRTDSLRFGGPAFFQGGTIDGDREMPRFDNPFLSDATREQIRAAYATVGLAPPSGSSPIVLRRNLLELGPRQEDAVRETTRIVLGVAGNFADDWNYEVSVNVGEFKEDTEVLGNLNQQRFLLAMDSTRNANGEIVCRSQIDPDAALIYPFSASNDYATSLLAGDVAACVPFNPFGEGNITPAMRNYLLSNTTSVAKIEQFVAAASISGTSQRWFELPAGPIGLALGVEHRTEDNYFKSDDLVENGMTFYNALPFFNPPTFEVSEAFTEFRVPLLADKPFAEMLTLNAAGRYADYKGATGEVLAHNYGLEWAPIDSLRFRVGKARAVRAPNLVDLYSALGQNFALVNDPCSARNIATGSATRAANCAAAGIPADYDFVYASSLSFLTGGNPNLKEETSDSFTAGFVFRPDFLPSLTLSVDYFDIDIDDVITAPTAQQILDACYDSADLNNQFCGLFQRAGAGGGPQGEEQYQILEGSLQQVVLNYASSTSRGIDLEVGFNQRLGSVGDLSTRLVYTHTLQRDDFLNPADPGYADQVLLELGDPEDAFNFNADFKRGPFTLGYELRYIGKMVLNQYEDIFSLQGRPPQNLDYARERYYPSVMYHDVRASYDFTDSLNVYVGVDNVADKVPPFGLTGQGGGTGGIGNSGIYESRGRFIFAGLKYNFGGPDR
ncbi:MAG TPA: TonB-dependent receptor [Steroidobacter sp.]|uniref:TonB-dependent receptor domain-containing protein n=1 Tax=Steroidobacter sp. TaxID=1978227 RepID=UPI002EDA6334